jgi:hypothetical protein
LLLSLLLGDAVLLGNLLGELVLVAGALLEVFWSELVEAGSDLCFEVVGHGDDLIWSRR